LPSVLLVGGRRSGRLELLRRLLAADVAGDVDVEIRASGATNNAPPTIVDPKRVSDVQNNDHAPRLELRRDQITDGIRVLEYVGGHLVYQVQRHASGAVTLRREIPKVRGKAARRRDKVNRRRMREQLANRPEAPIGEWLEPPAEQPAA
jgi:hypothetical protein